MFTDRAQAGVEVAKLLQEFRGTSAVVVGLPRGGVVTAKAVADALGLPLEITVVKKIGHPYNPEYALGAISERGFLALDEDESQRVSREWLTAEKEKKLTEAKEKRSVLWGERPVLSLQEKTVILVDDGIATGYTMLAALKQIRAQKPKQVVIAVPIAPRDTIELMRGEVESVRVVLLPETFAGAVGNYYQRFEEVTDGEVKLLLSRPSPQFMESEGDPVVFSMSGLESFATVLHARSSDYGLGSYQCVRYANQELRIELLTYVSKKKVVIVGCITPPHERIMETFLLAHTCVKDRAKEVILLLPYMAYTRHDHDTPKEDQGLALIAEIARSAGVSRVITIDIHGKNAAQLFSFPLESLQPWTVLAEKLQDLTIVPDVIVAPDEGAERRARALRSALHSSAELIVFQKQRSLKTVSSTIRSGSVRGTTAVLVDDILDTGTTLLLAIGELRKNGIQRFVVLVTHAVCSGSSWQALFEQGVEMIITTNSVVGSPAFAHPKCVVVPVERLMAEAVVAHA